MAEGLCDQADKEGADWVRAAVWERVTTCVDTDNAFRAAAGLLITGLSKSDGAALEVDASPPMPTPPKTTTWQRL